jgi:hypothetical protein
MSQYNPGDGASRTLSARRILDAIGAPFQTTTTLEDAVQYPVIITGSRILQTSFNPVQQNLIKQYVNNGGVLITSCLRDTMLYEMCGINTMNTYNKYYRMTFDTTAAPIFDWIQDSMEITVSLGKSSLGNIFYTQYYGLNTATALAHYEDGKNAIVQNNHGAGTTYLFGPDFRDIIYRNQIDFDYSAERSYSNGFEPTTDVFFMLIRNIIRKHIPHTVFKHTVPGKATSVLMITHDVDSRTAMDTMQVFSDYEKQQGINAMYNITTHYFHDTWMTNFYIGSWSKVHALIEDGHTLASHSVGHFPDFDNETLFPFGVMGNTPGNYNPAYTGGMTTGGTVLGELEVSKFLLENDHSVPIKSFRAGHLCYNDKLILGLDTLGYEFNTTFSANNILTAYPFYGIRERTYNGIETNVLEIPMTISDVFSDISASNYLSKVDIWTDVTMRYNSNHSPINLLIHPNRNYKLLAEIEYLNRLPASIPAVNMEDYGRFWRKRDSLAYHTILNNNQLEVHVDNESLTEDQSFVLDFAGLDTVLFFDNNGLPLSMDWMAWDYGTRLYFHASSTADVENNAKPQLAIQLYPNPSNDKLNVFIPKAGSNIQLEMYSIAGKKVFEHTFQTEQIELLLNQLNIEHGVYLLRVQTNQGVQSVKFVYTKP